MENQPQRKCGVVVLPSAAVPGTKSEENGEEVTALSKIVFPDSVTDASMLVPLYVVRKNSKLEMLVEIVRFTSSYGSWFFVPDSPEEVPHVCSNGNITMATAVDPLFCALVLLDAHRDVGAKQVFQPLDSLCVTADGTNLCDLCDHKQFETLCDTKNAAGIKFYKLNDEKALAWLVRKYDVISKQPNVKTTDALEIMSQYLTQKWKDRLRKHVLGDKQRAENETNGVDRAAQNLALTSMMEDAKMTNGGDGTENGSKKNTNPSKKTTPSKTKIVRKVPESSWWGKREKTLASGGKQNGKKRTRSSVSKK